MEKNIPYQKLSKSEKQRLNKKRRGSWGDIKPITRKGKNAKLYNRKRAESCVNTQPTARYIFALFYLVQTMP